MTSTHTSRLPRRSCGRLAVALLGAGSLGAAGCGSDPFTYKWVAQQDTVLLYSLARPEINLYSGFNFNQRTRVRIEAASSTGLWDVAVDTRDGKIVLLPPGALGVTSRAGIAVMEGQSYDDVTSAPADTSLYVTAEPVPVSEGNVYVVRTGRSVGSYGTYCVYYAKLAPLLIDPDGGTLTFAFDASPVCNDRSLVPPR